MKYRDQKGNYYEEESSQDRLLKWMYSHITGRFLLKGLVNPIVSKLGGILLNTKLSTGLISPFIKKNQIRMNEYEKKKYRSYNDFFTRKIRPEMRPICQEKTCFISPSDGKLSVYKISDNLTFQVKYTWYNLRSLVRNSKLATFYAGGTCVIIRLTVDDYHRYCYVDHGWKGKNCKIPGILHTVNPVANDFMPIFKENAREYTTIFTENFGKVTQIEVGALLVGKIRNYHEDKFVKKGQEKGYFEFGGSTIILLLEKEKVEIFPELFQWTEEGYETIVHMGETIGKAK
ncbi:Phosphatidylserine decarboxylase proenzyme [Clostridiales bacterium CHKCI001]|nr:Phosphatidylserine decarboxylase proenzyme [Clostridiales bacterium CHKCI001]